MTAPLALLLLTLQALAGGVVPLAHAGEPETAPVAMEAHHSATCIVLHDALRCALCQYAGSLTTPSSPLVLGARVPVAALRPQPAHPGTTRGVAHAGARPRAPPSPRS
jgi:hypothetical protein